MDDTPEFGDLDELDDCEVDDGRLVEFATRRLHARRIELDHAQWLETLHRDSEVMSAIGGVRSPVESADWLTTNLDHWERHRFGYWVLNERDGGTLVGRGGLRWIDDSVGEDIVEIGYSLARSAWGRGYATEAARAFAAAGFGHYGLAELGAITLDTNLASQRVLAKVGFVYERTVDHPIGPHRFFRLGRPSAG